MGDRKGEGGRRKEGGEKQGEREGEREGCGGRMRRKGGEGGKISIRFSIGADQ